MAWNKCTEKLPEVGMLVVIRGLSQYYNVGIVTASFKTVFRISDGDDSYTYRDFVTLEWKEIEKD